MDNLPLHNGSNLFDTTIITLLRFALDFLIREYDIRNRKAFMVGEFSDNIWLEHPLPKDIPIEGFQLIVELFQRILA